MPTWIETELGLVLSLLGVLGLFVFGAPIRVRRSGDTLTFTTSLDARDQSAMRLDLVFDVLGWLSLGIALVGIALQMWASQPGPAPAPQPPIGRYVVLHSPHAERDTTLLDTATGRTWSRVAVTDLQDEPVAWEPMPQLNSQKDLDALAASHPRKPSANDLLEKK